MCCFTLQQLYFYPSPFERQVLKKFFPLFDNTVQSFRQVENFCILYLAIILLVSNLIEYFKPRI